MTGYDPFEHAEQQGIRIIYRPIRTAQGLWLPEHNLIVIRTGLRAIHERSILAHELGHAMLGHTDDNPKHEHQADLYAANNLINQDTLVAASKWAVDIQVLAAELNVATRLLRAYLAAQGRLA